MGSFLRSASFPLIVIVLLVYLAGQTVLGDGGQTSDVPYSQVVQAVRSEPAAIERVVLTTGRGVTVERTDGTTWKARNPNEASQLALERMLVERRITYDWKPSGSSPWWSHIATFLPFALLIMFWIVLQRRRDEQPPTLDAERRPV